MSLYGDAIRKRYGAQMDAALAMLLKPRDPAPPTEPRQDRRRDATVYMLRCEGFVKIGYSVDPHVRLRQIRSMDGTKYPAGLNCSTTELLATECGGIDRERELHQRFAHLRHTGEWFTEAPELTEYIESLSEVSA